MFALAQDCDTVKKLSALAQLVRLHAERGITSPTSWQASSAIPSGDSPRQGGRWFPLGNPATRGHPAAGVR